MPLKLTRDEEPALNLTPMIDVLFLLLIFFMAGTKFIEYERKLMLKVPEVSNAAAMSSAPEKKLINVYRDGRITLDRKTVTLQQLTANLAAARSQYAELGVVVRGDNEGPLQHVASVLSACRDAGIAEMAISVRTPNEKR